MDIDDNVLTLTDKMVNLIHRHGRTTHMTPADAIMAIATTLSRIMAQRKWNATELEIANEMVSLIIMSRANTDDCGRRGRPVPDDLPTFDSPDQMLV